MNLDEFKVITRRKNEEAIITEEPYSKTPKYEPIAATQENVLVRVPIQSDFMSFVKAHEFKADGELIAVPDTWRSKSILPIVDKNGYPVYDEHGRKRLIISRIFYGINLLDVGKHIVAKVEVKKRIMPDGRLSIIIDSHKNKNSEATPLYEIKFLPKKESGIDLLHPKVFLHFVPYQPRGRKN